MNQVTRWVRFGIAGIYLARSAAAAADLSAPTYTQQVAPYSWTGVYIGANAGYGFATASATTTLPGFGATGSENLSGFVAGGCLGA